jgi:hypothetical protein
VKREQPDDAHRNQNRRRRICRNCQTQTQWHAFASRPGVVLIIKAVQAEQADRTFSFSSWDFLRERLRVFGFASAKELDTADVRLLARKRRYEFSSRRWEAPLIDALNLNCAPA